MEENKIEEVPSIENKNIDGEIVECAKKQDQEDILDLIGEDIHDRLSDDEPKKENEKQKENLPQDNENIPKEEEIQNENINASPQDENNRKIREAEINEFLNQPANKMERTDSFGNIISGSAPSIPIQTRLGNSCCNYNSQSNQENDAIYEYLDENGQEQDEQPLNDMLDCIPSTRSGQQKEAHNEAGVRQATDPGNLNDNSMENKVENVNLNEEGADFLEALPDVDSPGERHNLEEPVRDENLPQNLENQNIEYFLNDQIDNDMLVPNNEANESNFLEN